ncbi:hypothetical protein C772_00850 [Bhargavaea cecembensis DSE10]|uniref:Uncharacterized protein n=1 Tax=Bhargavaea cecembensis DSE10 TaxID=1235279 RepID=M7NZV9_9BACL|nr:hypothetical protein [Bhargavaea cecembensis]EMR07205.1 hypothetical protein C772_00850 [Bhargavaea cecembensis DSE10]
MITRRFSLTYLLVYFLVASAFQYVREGSVRWLDNLGIILIMFILFMLLGWTKTKKQRETNVS